MRFSDIQKMLGPLRRAINNLVGRAVVRMVDDNAKMQALQIEVLKGEVRDLVQRFQNYGFTSNPPVGAEALAVFIGGDRSHPIVVAVDDRRFRKKGLATGEVAVYTRFGDSILLKTDGTIEITASSTVKLTAPDIEIDGDLHVTGNVQVDGDVEADGMVSDAQGSLMEMRGVYNSHIHIIPSPSVDTNPPTTLMS